MAAQAGYTLWIPFGHSPDADLIAEDDERRFLRVQVKTSTVFRKGRWAVADLHQRSGIAVGAGT